MLPEHISVEPVKAYLLGNLDESESAAIEEKYFTDRAFFLHMQSVEVSLIEDYLDGRLTAPELQRFEERYLSVPDLKRKLDEVRASRRVVALRKTPVSQRTWPMLAVAAALVCFIGGGVLIYEQRQTRVETSSTASRISSLPLSPVATLSLRPGVLKGPGHNGAQLSLPVKQGLVAIVLDLPGLRAPAAFSARLLEGGADGGWKRVWTVPNPVSTATTAGAQQLTLLVDSGMFHRADYIIELVGADGEVYDTYSFRAS